MLSIKEVVKELRERGYITVERAGWSGALLYKSNPAVIQKAMIKTRNNRKCLAYISAHFLGEIIAEA